MIQCQLFMPPPLFQPLRTVEAVIPGAGLDSHATGSFQMAKFSLENFGHPCKRSHRLRFRESKGQCFCLIYILDPPWGTKRSHLYCQESDKN